jgi:hypothetical protein
VSRKTGSVVRPRPVSTAAVTPRAGGSAASGPRPERIEEPCCRDAVFGGCWRWGRLAALASDPDSVPARDTLRSQATHTFGPAAASAFDSPMPCDKAYRTIQESAVTES